MIDVQVKFVSCKQRGLCAFWRGFVAEEFLHLHPLEILPVWTSLDSLCCHSIILWISVTVSYANSASCCTLCIWTAFYQGIMSCMVISFNITPFGGDVEAQHFSQQKFMKPFFIVYARIVRPALLITLWINEFHHVACVYVFVWNNAFFICLVIFYIITNKVRGLIRPLQEPETLLMSVVFFLYLPLLMH